MSLYETHDWPDLNDPVLIVALEGWIDASGAAAAALALLDAACDARSVATFNSEIFLDYRARRPTMLLRDGINTGLVWPEIVLKAGRTSTGRDLVLLGGHEPDTQWRAWCQAVVELCHSLGVTRMIGLGAYPIAVPHTRPSRLSISCSTPSAADGLPFGRNSLDVPASGGVAIEDAMGAAGFPSLTLWAQVPHYLAASNYPPATVALLEGLLTVAGIEIDLMSIRGDAAATRKHVDGLVEGNPEHLHMLRQLEQAWDESESAPDGPLPSGDELAARVRTFSSRSGLTTPARTDALRRRA